MPKLRITYIGGPTALIEFGGLRFLTDPTFNPAGTNYPTEIYTLRKLEGPAFAPNELGNVDAVLLSHDHHYDNLDHAGRETLAHARHVFTTVEGAVRLGSLAVGLSDWQSVELATPDGGTVRITDVPARHGPASGDRGPVTGFVLAFVDALDDCVYVSGDTVWYEGIEEIGNRFNITTAVLFLGAAKVQAAGQSHLTMTAEEAVLTARLFNGAAIVPLHYAGWKHFSESRADIDRAFTSAGLEDRVHWLSRGVETVISWEAETRRP